MSPFSEPVRDIIRRRDKWECQDCGKSSFEKEKWLLEASHLDHTKDEGYDTAERGKTQCRVCHLLFHIDLHDWRGVNAIAQRIWDKGLCHYSVYDENPKLLEDHRIQLSEMLTAAGCAGKVHINTR